METYHEWMKGVLPITMSGCPALAAPAGFSDAGSADRHPDRRADAWRALVFTVGFRIRHGNRLVDQAPARSA